MTYERLTVTVEAGVRPRRVWALNATTRGDRVIIPVANAEGALTDEVILATAADIVRREPATMNLHYGALEVAK